MRRAIDDRSVKLDLPKDVGPAAAPDARVRRVGLDHLRARLDRGVAASSLCLPVDGRRVTRLIEERGIVGDAHRVTRDREDVDVLGPRWVAEEGIAGGHDNDVGLDHAGTLQKARLASLRYRR